METPSTPPKMELRSYEDLRKRNLEDNKLVLAKIMEDFKGCQPKVIKPSLQPRKKQTRKVIDPGSIRRNPARSTRYSSHRFDLPGRRPRSGSVSSGISSTSSCPSTPASTPEKLVVRFGFFRKPENVASRSFSAPDDSSDVDWDDEDHPLPTSTRKQRSQRDARLADDITQADLDMVATFVSDKKYDSIYGTTCHQCRQKTNDMKTVCRSNECSGVRGQFCGPCLRNRYGEDAKAALKDDINNDFQFKMGRKYSVYGCTSGYKNKGQNNENEPKVALYRFPVDIDECRRWIVCLPNKIDKITEHMGICSLHWPTDAPFIHRKGGRYPSPAVPPSIFPNVPSSCVPSHTPGTPRTTKLSLSSMRNPDVDEMKSFKEQDSLKRDTFQKDFTERFSPLGLFLSFSEENCVILSKERTGPIHTFSLYLTSLRPAVGSDMMLSYEAFYGIKSLIHPSLANPLRYWSQLEELLRFIRFYSVDNDYLKLQFLCKAIKKYNSPKNKRIYSLDDFILSFSWYAKSRSLYSDLREHLQLPSLSTLRKVTSVAKSINDVVLFKSVFDKMDERSRGCILIIDEVYVKASLTYSGGAIFGYAQDYPGKLATTFLCVMVKCFFGSKSFLVKLIPCHALKSDFQFTVVRDIILTLEECGAHVMGLVCDNNRVNQRFFNLFNSPNPACPWIANSPAVSTRPLFLIFDPVHILKNIRNSWITEKNQKLCFKHEGSPKSAHWTDRTQLFEHESLNLLKLSSLTKAAVRPNNIEKQKVSLALQIFSEKTSAALKTSSMSSDSRQETATFIDEVLRLWKVFNCKTPLQSIHQRDPDRAVLDSSSIGTAQRQTLLSWAEIAKDLEPTSTPRMCSLTLDTARAIQWTCKCLVDLSQHLLHTDAPYRHQYVAPGFFQQDDIEHKFAHFRMACGNTFYITAQDIMSTHAIDRAKLMLECENSSTVAYKSAGHYCDLCDKPLTDSELLIIDDLPDNLDSIITQDEKMSLFYIGGYLCQKHSENLALEGDPSLFPELLTAFTDYLNRGGLLFPSKGLFQLLSFVYGFFKSNPERSCRRRLIRVFIDFPVIFHLDISLTQSVMCRMVNIMMKRFCLERKTNRIRKEKWLS